MDGAEMSGPEAIPAEPAPFPLALPPAPGDLPGTLHAVVQSLNEQMTQVHDLLTVAAQLADKSRTQVHSLHLLMKEILPPVTAAADATKHGQTWGLVAAITAKISGKAILIYFVFVMFLLLRFL